jgi:hypothetical protein
LEEELFSSNEQRDPGPEVSVEGLKNNNEKHTLYGAKYQLILT